jgi:hypothetical protein
MKWIISLALFLPVIVFAHDLDLKSYLKLQEALAADDSKSATKIHSQICKGLGHYKDQYKGCDNKNENIDQLRESFKSLSALHVEHVDKKKLQELQVMECPMAKAKWIQRKGDVKNPYYGKSMLTCGQKV